MRTRHTRTSPLRQPRGPALEPLEPRQLLTAYLGQSFADYYHLPQVLLDNIAPPAGAVYADFGAAAAGLGDLDGDSYGDFAISAPGRLNTDGSTDIAGAVFIFSGKTGSLIRTLSDGFAGFGASIANLGDTSGDGKADLAVGSANFDGNDDGIIEHYGRAYIFSGANGAALFTLDGLGPSDELGYVVIGTGDVNRDTVPDLAIGAPGAGANAEGSVYVYSTAAGIPLYTLSGESAGDRFGAAVFTNTAVINPPDPYLSIIWVGAPLNDSAGTDAGRVYGFDSIAGGELWHHDGLAPGDRFGASLAGIPATRGVIPYVKLLVGAPGADVLDQQSQLLADAGMLIGIDGEGIDQTVTTVATGSTAGQLLGSGLWLAGPTDVVIWSPGTPSDQFTVHGQNNLVPLYGNGRAFDLGDLDGDGFDEVAVQREGEISFSVRSTATAFIPYSATSSDQGLTFVYFNATSGEGSAIFDGHFQRYSRIAGLHAADDILGVNDSHLIVGKVRGGDSSTIFIVRDGVRTLLKDAVTSIVIPPGPFSPHYDLFTFNKVVNNGTIVFTEYPPSGSGGSSIVWSFKDGVLTLAAFSATVLDVNNSGVILTVDFTGSTPATYNLHKPDGSTTFVYSSDAPFVPSHVSDSGAVAGIYTNFSTNRSDAAILHNGQITLLTSSLSSLPPPSGKNGAGPAWRVIGINASSQVLMEILNPVGIAFQRIFFLYDPVSGLHSLESIMFGSYPAHGDAFPKAMEVLSADGRLNLLGGVAAPTTDLSYFESASGDALSSAASTSTYSVIVNSSGDAVLFTRTGSSWTGARIRGLKLDTSGTGNSLVRQTLVSTDPATGLPTIFIVTPAGTYRVSRDGVWDTWRVNNSPFNNSPLTIIDHATLFVSSDKRVQLAGIDNTGDLILYFQTGIAGQWAVSDLTTEHIEASGQTFVPVAGNLTSFAMPWGAMNIAYLDASGNVQIVWWARGLPAWRIDNLSQNAGFTASLHGILTSYTTPWNGQNVAGTDESGNLVALWWAPGLPTWRTDRLVGGTPAQLDENTITAFSTPWGGLNVVGLNRQTGKLTAYWWAPGMPAWIVEEFKITGAPADLQLKGRVSAAVAPNGNMFIAAVTSDNHLANIWISPDTGLKWTFEDVTMAV